MPSLIWTDKPTTDDRLGFDDYRRTVVNVIKGADTPITIGVFGRWGGGKTSLMMMVEKDLKAAGAQTIWFDAWRYDKEEALWRALLVQVLRTLREALPETEKDARENLQDLQASLYRDVDRDKLGGVEIDWGKLIEQTTRGAVKLSLSFIPGWNALYNLTEQLKGQTDENTKAMFDAIHREKVRLHEDQARSLEQFQTRFDDAVSTFLEKTQRPFITVFVDDLDRCLPEKALEVLEAIKLFLDVPGCVFVMGVDRTVIERGIELKYAGRATGLPISGDYYLEKIVQVPFNLPPLDSGDIKKFIEAEISQTFLRTSAKENADGQEVDPKGDTDGQKVDPTILARVFTAGLEANPRKVKRTLNIFRLLQTLSNERAGLKDIQLELLAKIVVIQTRFREVYVDVVGHPNLLGDLENYFDREAQTARSAAESLPSEIERGQAAPSAEGELTLVGKHGRASYAKTLKVLLSEGDKRFRDTNPHPYVFLTRTATQEPETEQTIAVDEMLWDDLLSNDATRIRTAIENIADTEQLGYVKPLLNIMGDAKTYGAPKRVSAGSALAYLGDPRNLDEMVEIPSGEFDYGNAKERRRIDKAFRVSKYPVTNIQYQKFIDATGYDVPFKKGNLEKPYDWDRDKRAFPAGKANHPVVLVSWNDAGAYCEWLSKTTGRTFRLPTEVEWERAARSTDGREYPWGDGFNRDKANTIENGFGATSAVGAYPNGASNEGMLDASGNVFEWTASDSDTVKGGKVLRGGSWRNNQDIARCANRSGNYPDYRDFIIGFRIAESISP